MDKVALDLGRSDGEEESQKNIVYLAYRGRNSPAVLLVGK
jgi:hypothetical protein